MPGRDWFFTVTGANGGWCSTVPWRTARWGYVLNSPGYIEVDLLPEDVSNDWTPGDHRLQANTGLGVWQDGYLTPRPSALPGTSGSVRRRWGWSPSSTGGSSTTSGPSVRPSPTTSRRC